MFGHVWQLTEEVDPKVTHFHPGSGVNKVSLGILSLILVACGATPVEYESVESLEVAMANAGFECSEEEMEILEGTLGTIKCQFPAEKYPEYEFDYLQVTVFATELARVHYLISTLVWCGAESVSETPPKVAYVYGSTWAVLSGSCEPPLEVMSEIADAIGGQATVVDLAFYETFDYERPFEDWTTNELKDFLGEPVTESTETAAQTGDTHRRRS